MKVKVVDSSDCHHRPTKSHAFRGETHAFRPTLTLTRHEISRVAVNVTHILIICVKNTMCLRFLHNSAYLI